MSQRKKQGKSWGDDDEEEDPETKVDAHGIKERVRYSENAKGQKVKVTMKIKVNDVTLRVPKRVAARRNMPRFGDANEGEQNVTLLSKEFIPMEHPDDALIEDKDTGLASTLREFIQRQNERQIVQESGFDIDNIGDNIFGNSADGAAEKKEETKSDKYIPPGAKGRPIAGGGSTIESAFGPAKDTTIRVSNLPKQVTDDDVRDLFEPFGRVLRLAVPKAEKIDEQGRTIKEPRGFAYITYLRPEDAEDAFNTLQGYGYGHLILRLEWSKPMVKDPASSGLSGSYVSGYGTKLAQDTKEKVHGYTDQGAHNASNTGFKSGITWGARR